MNPLILGIEGTAHTLGLAIIDGSSFLSDVRSVYTSETGGIHPRDSAQKMAKVFPGLLRTVFEKARVSPKELHAVAFARGPGLGPCLRTSATVARTVSLVQNIPLIGVNHCIAHIEIGRLTCQVEDPLTLYISGGNSQIIFFNDIYRTIGETQDIAVGNFLDAIAREMGFGHPGGPIIEKLAEKGSKFIDFPYTVKGMSFSFSGLFTAVKKHIEQGKSSFEDISFSIQEIAFGMLAEVTERALVCTNKQKLLVVGGVAANNRLHDMLNDVCEEHGVSLAVVSNNLAADNGVMIAWLGHLNYKEKRFTKVSESTVFPRWRVDEVSTPWRD